MPATDDDTLLPFSSPPLCHKEVSAAFDGGTISSDGGVFLLAGADKRLGLIDRRAVRRWAFGSRRSVRSHFSSVSWNAPSLGVGCFSRR